MRQLVQGKRFSMADRVTQQGRAFWMAWAVCLVLLAGAFYVAGSLFAAIAFGGIIGCVGAMLLGEMSEFTHGDEFDAGSAVLAVLAAVMSCAGFFAPVDWTVVAGCLLSSGLLLSFLLKRLDRETGMNIQSAIWLGTILTALLAVFLYVGPYIVVVRVCAYLFALTLYGLFLLNLADGAEQGLQGAWYVALIIGIASFGGTAFNQLGIDPEPAVTFSGLATGLGCTMLYAPLKTLLEGLARRHEEDWRDFL